MKKFFAFLSAALCCAIALNAQQALGPGTGIVSPEIHPDHSVTFRLYAPKAMSVRLTGDFLPAQRIEYEADGRKQIYEAPGSVDLREGPGGIWTWTSAPLAGELYSYSFVVDGARTMDPSNIYQNRDIAT